MDLGLVQMEVSEVRNREMVIPGASEGQMRALHRELQTALFKNLIPHYRPIGVCIKGKVSYAGDTVTRVAGVNKSYIELWRDMRSLIMAEGGGFQQEGLLKLEKVDGFGFVYAMGNVTTSNGSVRFCGVGEKVAPTLVKNMPLVNLEDGCEVRVVMYRGVGMVDFARAESIMKFKLRNSSKYRYVPLRAVYSLYDNLVIQPYKEDDGDSLRFTYKCDIDEAVLTRIIQDYARDLGGQRDGCQCKDIITG